MCSNELNQFIQEELMTNPVLEIQNGHKKTSSDALNKRGINISRRTVEKYRSQLRISSSTKRKR
ncbi:MAG: Sigma-54, binding domain [Candidatus Petromonas sp.]|jgi:DNA-directed RNA polymerase specialized sigma54-like protein|nr:Sigma-54, binding domain [Candidatus Petromonas sp.]